jgi:protein-tyrosine kinase
MGRMFDALQKAERDKNREEKEDLFPQVPQDIVLDTNLVSFFAPSSTVSEQFRRLRTFIIKPGAENPPRTILVTSTLADEGKSFVAINLAITIATELNSNALLVDCDLRRPSLSRWFGLQEGKGLSDYLTGQAALPELFIRTSVDKLSILAGGATVDNPVELIGSNRMKSLITELKTRYEDRYIVLDSSPLLATTEPNVLHDMVDGIILVVKSGVTPRESVQQALKGLDKEKILGVVLNGMEFKTEALVERYFGARRYYHEYNHAKDLPDFGAWGKFTAAAKDMKGFVGKLRPKKNENL